ncbi:MAG: FadR family transcriptional regulator [Acidobacteria bacterium]|nr:FadR family transcriptional regulator [Acidobacteriota bacterium]
MPHSKVSDRIVRQLQHRIATGELKPGDRLPPERQLATSLGASRASVREAVRVLELSGLVSPRHGEGTFVQARPTAAAGKSLSQFLQRERERLVDLSQARLALEPRLASLAAEHANRDDIERLRQALYAEINNIRGHDVEGALVADRAFHLAIAEATHSPTFMMLHTYLSDLVADIRREAIFNESRRTPARHVDHQAILKAIAAGDASKAEAAMRLHLKHVEGLLIDALQAYQQTAAGLSASKRARGPRARQKSGSAFSLTGLRAAD